MKTLLLTLILLLPLSSIADVPCYQAIQSQHDSIDSLETRLKTAESLPYNQGYQEGYKVATLLQWKPDQYIQVFFWCAFITVVIAFASMFVYALVFAR